MRILYFKCIYLASFLFLGSLVHAQEFCISPLFADHMVIQRGKPFCIFGTAKAGTRVTAQIVSSKVSTTTSAQGEWQVCLPSMQPQNKTYELTVESEGNKQLVFNDLIVGDVW